MTPQDVYKELREQTVRFIKLDFGYLAALGVIVTTLRATPSDIVDQLGQNEGLAQALIFIFAFDAFVDRQVFTNWLTASKAPQTPMPRPHIRVALTLQYLFHISFVVFLLSGVVSYISGMHHAYSRFGAMADLQEEVEHSLLITGKVPSLAALSNQSARAQNALTALRDQSPKLESVGASSYRLTFAGPDKQIGTADDEVATPEVRYRSILNAIRESKTESPMPKCGVTGPTATSPTMVGEINR